MFVLLDEIKTLLSGFGFCNSYQSQNRLDDGCPIHRTQKRHDCSPNSCPSNSGSTSPVNCISKGIHFVSSSSCFRMSHPLGWAVDLISQSCECVHCLVLCELIVVTTSSAISLAYNMCLTLLSSSALASSNGSPESSICASC